ncbi:MAG: DUF1800 domain-containing protein [Polyangiaceae bacterium]
MSRIMLLAALAGCSASSGGPTAAARDAAAAPVPSATPIADAAPDAEAVARAHHALDRLGFGARPGEAERVAREGVDAWIARQMQPATLPDAQLEEALRALPSLSMSMKELITAYPKPKPMPAKPDGAAEGDDAKGRKPAAPAAPSKAKKAKARPGELDMDRIEKPGVPAAKEDAGKKPRQILADLSAQKVMRAVQSERQLQEVLVDFWFNHFNVFARKSQQTLYTLGDYERTAIRPNVFGKFRDLLGATAQHPAMLFYLDNYRSAAEQGATAGAGAGKKPAKAKARGLNENYGRELLELHTVGVDGGYSQDDVRQAARALTGWTVNEPAADPAFVFRPAMHDTGAKTVLGTALDRGGKGDGEQLLDLLARRPETARFVARKLAQRFVSDAPPQPLVDRLAETFTRTDGDLRAVYTALFASPEMWAPEARTAKTRKPFELAASALRATGASYDGSPQLVGRIERLGEPLYRCQPPTGYKDTADAWVSTGALVSRINFGIDLAAGKIQGVKMDTRPLAGSASLDDSEALVDALSAALLHRAPSAGTRATILAALKKDDAVDYQEPSPTQLPQAVGLLLGSPEFQKR